MFEYFLQFSGDKTADVVVLTSMIDLEKKKKKKKKGKILILMQTHRWEMLQRRQFCTAVIFIKISKRLIFQQCLHLNIKR